MILRSFVRLASFYILFEHLFHEGSNQRTLLVWLINTRGEIPLLIFSNLREKVSRKSNGNSGWARTVCAPLGK